MWQIASVEHIVLDHEENVKYDREEPQPKLCGVPEQTGPVIIVVGDQEHLEHAEAAPREVQEDVADTPANSALPPVMDRKSTTANKHRFSIILGLSTCSSCKPGGSI